MKHLVLGFALIASPALAQQPQSFDQRIATQVGAMFIQNTSQGVEIEQLKAALATAQARVKALEDKYEPKEGAAK